MKEYVCVLMILGTILNYSEGKWVSKRDVSTDLDEVDDLLDVIKAEGRAFRSKLNAKQSRIKRNAIEQRVENERRRRSIHAQLKAVAEAEDVKILHSILGQLIEHKRKRRSVMSPDIHSTINNIQKALGRNKRQAGNNTVTSFWTTTTVMPHQNSSNHSYTTTPAMNTTNNNASQSNCLQQSINVQVPETGEVILESPMYPNNYPNNACKSWRLAGPNGQCMVFQVVNFQTERRYDFLRINGVPFHGGYQNGGYLYRTDSNSAGVVFNSDFSITRQGFSIKVRTTGCNEIFLTLNESTSITHSWHNMSTTTPGPNWNHTTPSSGPNNNYTTPSYAYNGTTIMYFTTDNQTGSWNGTTPSGVEPVIITLSETRSSEIFNIAASNGQYDNNQRQEWKIVIDEGNNRKRRSLRQKRQTRFGIQIAVDSYFETEYCCDKIHIRYRDDDGEMGYQYSGCYNNGAVLAVTNAQEIFISFSSDYSVTSLGASLRATMTPSPAIQQQIDDFQIPDSCVGQSSTPIPPFPQSQEPSIEETIVFGETYYQTHEIILTNYENNLEKIWPIQGSSGQGIEIRVSHFTTEQGYDFVRIYKISGNGTRLLVSEVSGDIVDNFPLAKIDEGGRVEVQFSSDQSVTDAGFTLQLRPYRPGNGTNGPCAESPCQNNAECIINNIYSNSSSLNASTSVPHGQHINVHGCSSEVVRAQICCICQGEQHGAACEKNGYDYTTIPNYYNSTMVYTNYTTTHAVQNHHNNVTTVSPNQFK